MPLSICNRIQNLYKAPVILIANITNQAKGNALAGSVGRATRAIQDSCLRCIILYLPSLHSYPPAKAYFQAIESIQLPLAATTFATRVAASPGTICAARYGTGFSTLAANSCHVLAVAAHCLSAFPGYGALVFITHRGKTAGARST